MLAVFWNVRCEVRQSMGRSNMLIVRHEDESGYSQLSAGLLKCAEDPRIIFGLEHCCIDRPYDSLVLSVMQMCGAVRLIMKYVNFSGWLADVYEQAKQSDGKQRLM